MNKIKEKIKNVITKNYENYMPIEGESFGIIKLYDRSGIDDLTNEIYKEIEDDINKLNNG